MVTRGRVTDEVELQLEINLRLEFHINSSDITEPGKSIITKLASQHVIIIKGSSLNIPNISRNIR